MEFFGRNFSGGFFWEDIFWRIFMGGFLGGFFLQNFSGGIFWEKFFGRIFWEDIFGILVFHLSITSEPVNSRACPLKLNASP